MDRQEVPKPRNRSARLLTLTQLGMLAYWIVALLAYFEAIEIDPALIYYSDYANEITMAWNWSFLPIDVLFAILGLFSRFVFNDPQRKATAGTISLSLMFCSGLMAISFWLLRNTFDPVWWIINLWLMLLSSVLLVRKLKQTVSVDE